MSIIDILKKILGVSNLNIGANNIINNDNKEIGSNNNFNLNIKDNIIGYNVDYANGEEIINRNRSMFSYKIDTIIDLINYDGNNNKINKEKMSFFLGYKSVNDLNKYYYDINEPEFDTMDKISDKLGIYARWLSFGDGNPFESMKNRLHNPFMIYDDDDFKKCKNICFVIKSNEDRRYLTIVLEMNEYKYVYFPYEYVFRGDNIGGSGTSEMIRLFKFFIEFRKKYYERFNNYVHFCVLPDEEYDNLVCGKIYPGKVMKYYNNNYNYLIEDMTILSEEQVENNKKMYGLWLYKIQKLMIDNKSYIFER